MNKRFMVDDAGTLIDMQTRDMFDIVEEVCPLLNILADENEQLKETLKELKEIGDYQSDRIQELNDENEQLKQQWKEKRHEDINELSVIAMKYKALENKNEYLKQENKGIQDKVWKLLELLEKEKGIDKRKIIDWWNGDVE